MTKLTTSPQVAVSGVIIPAEIRHLEPHAIVPPFFRTSAVQSSSIALRPSLLVQSLSASSHWIGLVNAVSQGSNMKFFVLLSATTLPALVLSAPGKQGWHDWSSTTTSATSREFSSFVNIDHSQIINNNPVYLTQISEELAATKNLLEAALSESRSKQIYTQLEEAAKFAASSVPINTETLRDLQFTFTPMEYTSLQSQCTETIGCTMISYSGVIPSAHLLRERRQLAPAFCEDYGNEAAWFRTLTGMFTLWAFEIAYRAGC